MIIPILVSDLSLAHIITDPATNMCLCGLYNGKPRTCGQIIQESVDAANAAFREPDPPKIPPEPSAHAFTP